MKKTTAIILPAFIALMCGMITGCNAKKKFVDSYSVADHSKTQAADSSHVQKSGTTNIQDNIKTLKTDSGTVTTTTKTDITIKFDNSGHKTEQTEHTETTTQIRGTRKTATQNNSMANIAKNSDSTGTHKATEQKDIKAKGRHVDVATKPSYGWVPWLIGAVILVIAGIFLVKKCNLI